MNDIQRIKDNRDLIIVAEIGALLHDLGKLSEEFIAQQSKECFNSNRSCCDECNFDHQKIFKGSTPKFDYSNFLSENFKNSISDKTLLNILNKDLKHKNGYIFNQKLVDMKQIIEKHDDKGHGAGLIKLLASIDGLDSGVDKGVLHDNGKQPKDNTYQATSFGYEANTIDVLKLKPIRDQLCTELTNKFNGIAQASGYTSELLKSRNDIHELVKRAFLEGLGDTRRSGNDVTLWDHSYSVASLYKSALVKIIYENKWTEPREIKWKIIGVQYDKLGLIEKAHKLADIAGYRKLTNDVDERIKKIIEEEIPLGNEIYRDETGIYFSGPDVDKDKLLNLIKGPIFDTFQKETNGEVIPYINISAASRSLVILTELLKYSRHKFLRREIIPKWIEDWEDASSRTVSDTDLKQRSFCKNQCERDCVAREGTKEHQIDICPVCGVHPKCEHQEVCKHCLKRRKSRIEAWKNEKYPTIWIDEIADKNKRVAVVTGRFNLAKWLNGALLNTVFSQALENYGDNCDWANLRAKIAKCLRSNEKKSVLLKKIARDAYHDEPARDFYDKIVVDRNPLWKDADKIDWDNSADCQIAAERLLLTIFRKHPSPARLRRIWTTTKTFWKEVQNELEKKQEIYPSDDRDIRFKRLEIELKNSENLTRTLQNVKLENIDILMYFDGEKLISAQNLEFSGLNKEIDLNKYAGKSIKIKGEGEKDSEFKNFEIEEISWGESYSPFLDVLLSPVSFQFIVPANSVPQVLRMIQDKYSDEMGGVAGRLPLNVGVIFFDYKTALYAAINASRKMLQGFEDKPYEQFLVKSIVNGSSIELINEDESDKKINFKNTTKVSSMHYRNFIVANHSSVANRKSYFKSFIDSRGVKEVGLLNASNLENEDSVMIYTNHFDFEFLDTTARRLEIRYKDWKRSDQNELRGPRPYYLEEFNTVLDAVWKLFDRADRPTISQTQIKKIQSQLTKLNLDWVGYESSDEFKTQIENILINIGTRKWWNSMEKGEQELLMQVCLDKTIFDILEFYNSILKSKLDGDTNE